MSDAQSSIPPRRRVQSHDRDFGVQSIYAPDTSSETIAAALTKRQCDILLHLLDAVQPGGPVLMTSRAELRAGADTMQDLYYCGLVNGAGTRDARGTGNTPNSSWWWLTTLGERVATAIREGHAR